MVQSRSSPHVIRRLSGFGTGASDDDAFMQLPEQGILQSVSVISTSGNQGPVQIVLSLFTGGNGTHLTSGWCRGNNYADGDAVVWDGEIQLGGPERSRIFIGFRNDQTGLAAIQVTYVVEIP